MTYLHVPSEQRLFYDPPQDNVLLVTCMDLRLIDDIVDFMNHDNLRNRYDHVVFAGAALGALGAPGGKDECGKPNEKPHWQATFADHLGAAVELHGVKDVYLLEHRNCGAYTKVFHIYDEQDPAAADDIELTWHMHYAAKLEDYIANWSQDNSWPLKIHKFIMDLRGNVSVLSDSGPLSGGAAGKGSRSAPPKQPKSKKGKRKKS